MKTQSTPQPQPEPGWSRLFKFWCWAVWPVFVPSLAAGPTRAAVNPSDFVSHVDNPYYPLVPGTTSHFEGSVDRIDIIFVTHEIKVICGVRCTVVRDRAIVNGLLSEDTFDWYAQDKAGNVWLFGEGSSHFDASGTVITTAGSWEAGVNGAAPGMIMPANPQVNQTYRQELAPGVAEDMATVLALDARVEVPFGTFFNCMQTRDFSPLNPGQAELNYYAPGIGLVRTVQTEGGDEWFELGGITREPINPADFVARVDHPYVPLVPGTTLRYEGTIGIQSVVREVFVTLETKVILGVTCTVVSERTSTDGVLTEDTLDWYAQDHDGNVWFFGEETRKPGINGVIIRTEDSWEAGRFGAQPGIIMPAHPKLQQTYLQERAPGVALSMATVWAVDTGPVLALGSFTNCVGTRVFSPLRPGEGEYRYYAPGIGLILAVMLKGDAERLELVSVHPRGAPSLRIARRVGANEIDLILYGVPRTTYVLEISGDLVSWQPFLTNTLSGNQLEYPLTNVLNNARRFFRGALP